MNGLTPGSLLHRFRASKRWRRNIRLGVIAVVLVLTIYWAVGFSPETWVDIPDRKAESLNWRVSMALAYTALLFLAATLAVGPLNLLRKQPNPAHNALRRDLGIWSGLIGLNHMAAGMLIHTDGLQVWTLFVHQFPGPHDWLPLHRSLFGLANYTGLLQGSLLALLLLISNNLALRRLGLKRWKSLQRLSYVAAGSILIHALSYQSVERRELLIRGVFLALAASIVVLQSAGVLITLLRRREKEANQSLTTIGQKTN